ncbi:MAG: Gfo/Idh/MocA family oxidoreductase [Micromonosporaceae bacterium]
MSNPGTERARYLQLPNASIGFPHVPGSGAVGCVVDAGTGLRAGELVAVRAGTHASLMVVPVERLHAVPEGAHYVDAALWQMGLIAMHGLGMGQYVAGEPVAIVGTGLVGAMARRVAIARGATECTAVAMSTAKQWSVAHEPATRFVTADAAGAAHGQHPLVIDATGTAAGLATAMAAVADGGRVVLLGSPRIPTAPVPVRDLHERGLRLVGAHIDTLRDAGAVKGEDLLAKYTDEYFSLIGTGRLSAADLVTVFTPGQAELLYRQLIDDRSLVCAAVTWRRASLGRFAPTRGGHMVVREPEPPMRFALVGCGDIGFQNAEALGRSTRATLVSCFDTDPTLSAALADHTRAHRGAGLADLLSDPGVDAVLVATPHDTHERIALATLDAGKHLLLQKPLAADLAAAKRITRAAGRASSTTSVLFPGRYEAAYRNARRAHDQRLIGEPSGLIATYLVDKPPSYYRGGYSMRSASTWRLSKARSGGGILIMNLLHHLDAAQSLLRADAEWVFAQTAASPHSAEIEDFASVMVKFGKTVATFVGAASVPGSPGEQFRFWGTAGHCVVYPRWRFASAARRDIDVCGRPEPDDPQAAAIDSFVDAARAGRDPDVTVQDALGVQAIVAAAYESARTGLPVRPVTLLEEV